MDLEDQIAKIIGHEYGSTGFVDEGRSTAAAHDIMNLLEQLIKEYFGDTYYFDVISKG